MGWECALNLTWGDCRVHATSRTRVNPEMASWEASELHGHEDREE